MLFSLSSLLYPPLCLSCDGLLEEDEKHLCQACIDLLVPLDPIAHCIYCLRCLESEKFRVCPECRGKRSVFKEISSVFPFSGPAGSLIKGLKYNQQPYLAESIASWIFVQWESLKWPSPDAIVPVPLSWIKMNRRGYNQTALIAKQLAQYMKIPVLDCLQRSSLSKSQAGLKKAQRLEQESFFFTYDAKFQIDDKNILLIDDVMTTGTTLRNCGYSLLTGHPNLIYAMTFCYAEKD